jgi:hypothetical protein
MDAGPNRIGHAQKPPTPLKDGPGSINATCCGCGHVQFSSIYLYLEILWTFLLTLSNGTSR